MGVAGGIVYAKTMLWALATIWRNAIGGAELQFHVTAASLAIGLCASTVVAVLTIWLTLRKQARQPARELLAGEVRSPKSKVRSRGVWIALGSGLTAVAIVGWALASGHNADAEAFFSAGALLLVAGLAAASAWLGRLAQATGDCSHHASRRSQAAAAPPSPPLEERAGERRSTIVLDPALGADIPAGCPGGLRGQVNEKDSLLSPTLSSKGGEGAPPAHTSPARVGSRVGRCG